MLHFLHLYTHYLVKDDECMLCGKKIQRLFPHMLFTVCGGYCYFTELRQWASLCLHFAKISSLWFRSVFWSLCNSMVIFSVRQRSHFFPPSENACALVTIDHFILKSEPIFHPEFINFQAYFERVVWFEFSFSLL